jgi:hypothetical protein
MELVDVNSPIPDDKMELLRGIVEGCVYQNLSDLAAGEINRKLLPKGAAIRDGETIISMAITRAYQRRLAEFMAGRKGVFLDMDADLLAPYAEVIVDELFDRFEAAL